MKIKLSDISEGKLTDAQAEALQTYFKAGGTWVDLLKLKPSEVEEVYANGYRHYVDGEYDKALASFSALIQLNPYIPKHWVAIGAALQASQQYSDALAAYELALSLDPELVPPVFYCAQCAYALDNVEKCRELLKKVTEIAQEKDEIFAQKAALILPKLKESQGGS